MQYLHVVGALEHDALPVSDLQCAHSSFLIVLDREAATDGLTYENVKGTLIKTFPT